MDDDLGVDVDVELELGMGVGVGVGDVGDGGEDESVRQL